MVVGKTTLPAASLTQKTDPRLEINDSRQTANDQTPGATGQRPTGQRPTAHDQRPARSCGTSFQSWPASPGRARLYSADAHADCDIVGHRCRGARAYDCFPGAARPGRRDGPSRRAVLACDSALRQEDRSLSYSPRGSGKHEQRALPAQTIQRPHYQRGFQAAACGRGATDGRSRNSGSGGDWRRHDTRSITPGRGITECVGECIFAGSRNTGCRDTECLVARGSRRLVAWRISRPGTRCCGTRQRCRHGGGQLRVGGFVRSNLVRSKLNIPDKDGPIQNRSIRDRLGSVRDVDRQVIQPGFWRRTDRGRGQYQQSCNHSRVQSQESLQPVAVYL